MYVAAFGILVGDIIVQIEELPLSANDWLHGSLTGVYFTTHSRLVFTTHGSPGVYQTFAGWRVCSTVPPTNSIVWRGKIVEHLHMNSLRDLIHRLRCSESQRRIARDLSISRPTVHKYQVLAEAQGYLQPDSAMPGDATLMAALGGMCQAL